MNTLPRRRIGRFYAPLALAVGLGLLGSALFGSALGQDVKQSLSVFDTSSGYIRETTTLVIWGLVFAALIFIGTSAALFYTVFKFREDKNTAEPAQFHGNNRLEITLIAAPVVIVMVLGLLTVRTMARTIPTPTAAIPLNAVAAQFYWNFEYPNEKVTAPATGLVTNGNELIVPVKTPIAVTATSRDVIHGFWAPNLGGQRDAIPSVKKTWQIDTNSPGVYQGNCTLLCGASHANMRFKVIALPQADFDQFVSAAKGYQAPAPAANSPEAVGYGIFMQGKDGAGACAACHRVQGTPALGQSGPDLSFFGTRRTLGAGKWEGKDVDANLYQWLRASSSIKPGSVMPHYDGSTPNYPALTNAEFMGLIAYLKSLKLPTGGNYWNQIEALVPNAPVPAPQGATAQSVTVPPTTAQTEPAPTGGN
ncbi:cytochrome c oxidase subunit II [Deinococcus sp.]|uniref:cytochrome c oxidase subunit II n=1 Tax=Deinococcus sp. TaxID=47478 RepID=UPI003B5B0A4C